VTENQFDDIDVSTAAQLILRRTRLSMMQRLTLILLPKPSQPTRGDSRRRQKSVPNTTFSLKVPAEPEEDPYADFKKETSPQAR